MTRSTLERSGPSHVGESMHADQLRSGMHAACDGKGCPRLCQPDGQPLC